MANVSSGLMCILGTSPEAQAALASTECQQQRISTSRWPLAGELSQPRLCLLPKVSLVSWFVWFGFSSQKCGIMHTVSCACPRCTYETSVAAAEGPGSGGEPQPRADEDLSAVPSAAGGLLPPLVCPSGGRGLLHLKSRMCTGGRSVLSPRPGGADLAGLLSHRGAGQPGDYMRLVWPPRLRADPAGNHEKWPVTPLCLCPVGTAVLLTLQNDLWRRARSQPAIRPRRSDSWSPVSELPAPFGRRPAQGDGRCVLVSVWTPSGQPFSNPWCFCDQR